MTGAAVLTAQAALRADVGYVTLAVPQASLAVAETLALEPVKRGFDWQGAMDSLAGDIARSDALAVGPGLGRTDEARTLVRRLLGRPICRPSSTQMRSSGSSLVRRDAPDGADAARGRAGASARNRRRVGQRAPTRGGCGGG